MRCVRAGGRALGLEHHGVRLPYIPPFLQKHDGFVLSLGQFQQWVAAQVMATGAAQIWPASPVAAPLFGEGDARVTGVRLVDQGTDARGVPGDAYAPGMDVFADLTVVGDGPIGAVGHALDARFGVAGRPRQRDEWALGMKMVVDLRDDVDLAPGTVIHTSVIPSRRSSGSSTCSRRAPCRSASSCRRGSTAPCAPRTATCSTGCCTRGCGAGSRAARCARGARSRCRNRDGAASRTSSATASRASARDRAARTRSAARAWTRRGRRGRSSPKA